MPEENIENMTKSEFDSFSKFLFGDGSMGKNFIIFGADMSSSAHIENKGKIS